MRRVSTASRANAQRVRSPATQRSTALKASPTYIATSAANSSGSIDPWADTDAASGLTTKKAAAPVTAEAQAVVRLWKRALGSARSSRRPWKTMRATKARPKNATVSAGEK